MLFTWDTTNLCIVFRSWRITGTWSLLWSLLAVMALTAGYEAVREACRRYEARQAAQLEHLPSKSTSTPTRRCVEIAPLQHALIRTPRWHAGARLTAAFRKCRCGWWEAGWRCGQGGVLWGAGVLFVLHHVSRKGEVFLWIWGANAMQATVHDIQWLDHACRRLRGVFWVSHFRRCERNQERCLSLSPNREIYSEAYCKHTRAHSPFQATLAT